MVTEGAEQDVFQLLQGDSLHVELREKEMRRRFLKRKRPFSLHINKLAVRAWQGSA